MNIVFVEIQNFRKLKSYRIEIASQETVFVGANNSGKTSAMNAMILFFKKNRRKDIATTDFTLSNWSYINKIGIQWVHADDDNMPDLTVEQWLSYLPTIDIWLDVNDADIHHVIHLLPTLDWKPDQKLGVRRIFAPKNIEKLYKEFRDAYQLARDTESTASSNNRRNLSLWPESMQNFLDRNLHQHCEVKAYILDPAQCKEPIDESQDTQKDLVNAFFAVQSAYSGEFCLALFGDTMQRIYSDGKIGLGEAVPSEWKKPAITINYRCPERIVKLINKIRSSADDHIQEPADDAPEGFVRLRHPSRNKGITVPSCNGDLG